MEVPFVVRKLLTMEITVIKSNRKTVSIQVNADLSVTVRAPRYASSRELDRILREKEPWIRKQIELIREQKAKYEAEEPLYLTNAQIRELADSALEYIPKRAEYFSKLIGVDYGRITIRNQKTRWGSCSSKGNLNFNCLLMLAPSEVIDAIVVHELCHLKQMNHSKKFYDEVLRVFPEYRKWNKWLRDNGGVLMQRAGH